jgi:hypothetical protein
MGVNISAMGRLGGLAIAGLAIVSIGACGPFCGSGKVSVTNAHVDSTSKCPNPADKFAYKVHGSIDVDNPSSKTLTIKSMTEESTTVAIHGSWSGQVGAKGSESIDDFSPTSIKSGDKATVKFTIAFNCTNSGPTQSTYGDFQFKFTVVTSGGTFNLNAANKYRLVIT